MTPNVDYVHKALRLKIHNDLYSNVYKIAGATSQHKDVVQTGRQNLYSSNLWHSGTAEIIPDLRSSGSPVPSLGYNLCGVSTWASSELSSFQSMPECTDWEFVQI